MKQRNNLWQFASIMLLIATMAFTGCTKCQQKTEGNLNPDLSDRYRSIVNSEFQKKAQQKNADTRYLIIVDYSKPSNSDRLFLWDTERDGIVEMCWCAHGNGGGSTAEKPVFSNKFGSKCSSLGWYLVDRNVGKSPHWGYNYHAVDGLDSTNSNAHERQILIHPWSSVSYDETTQRATPMKLDGRCEGCFTISEKGFETLDSYIKSRQKRILLWAINGTE